MKNRQSSAVRISIVVGLVASAIGISSFAQSQQAPPYSQGKGTVPENVKERALQFVRANYGGRVEAVYGEAATTLADFKELEPSNGMSLEMRNETADSSIFAVFFRGQGFSTEAPIIHEAPEGTVTDAEFRAGRVVVDEHGEVLNLQLWQVERSAREAFGRAHDDQ